MEKTLRNLLVKELISLNIKITNRTGTETQILIISHIRKAVIHSCLLTGQMMNRIIDRLIRHNLELSNLVKMRNKY